MKPTWITKLSSRKFWMALAGFATAILTALNIDKLTIEQVYAIITAVGSLAVFILAEGFVDGKRASTESTDDPEPGV